MYNYFLVTPKETPEMAFALAPEIERAKMRTRLINEVAALKNLDALPFDFKLIKLSSNKKGLIESDDLAGLKEKWTDCLPNIFSWPLYSERLKSIFDAHLTGQEGVDWIQTTVHCRDEEKIYYIPVFQKKLDVLNIEKTVYGADTDSVLIPGFEYSKVKNYSFFPKPAWGVLWKISYGFIPETLKKAIQKEKLVGIAFEKIVAE